MYLMNSTFDIMGHINILNNIRINSLLLMSRPFFIIILFKRKTKSTRFCFIEQKINFFLHDDQIDQRYFFLSRLPFKPLKEKQYYYRTNRFMAQSLSFPYPQKICPMKPSGILKPDST